MQLELAAKSINQFMLSQSEQPNFVSLVGCSDVCATHKIFAILVTNETKRNAQFHAWKQRYKEKDWLYRTQITLPNQKSTVEYAVCYIKS